VITWTIKLKFVSIVDLDPQGALIFIGTHIVKQHVIVYLLCRQVSVKAHWAACLSWTLKT